VTQLHPIEPVERVAASAPSAWSAEHRSRYHFAAPFVEGKRVLDIACGAGYGARMLLEAGAASVVGVDASSDALAEAEAHAGSGLEFLRADGTDLPLADGTFDVTVSFETVEHIEDSEQFVRELRRVTAPDGVLVLSTPNALHTRSLPDRMPNPFHVREFTPGELRELLGGFFGEVSLLGQRPHPRVRPCPFWERPSNLPTGLPGRLAVWAWKLENRLPSGLGDRISRALHGRPLLPGEHDFVFRPDEVDSGHVLLAICRG
jgi:SAM-dependent methyltransferase